MIKNNILELIGTTPVVKLNNIVEENWADIYVKLEYFNPAGSIKDRVALHMIEVAENQGKLNRDSVIIEPTSGNTGIGLAMVGAVKGYKVILVMPETMSLERRRLLKAYGAEIILTPGAKGMKGSIERAEELVKNNDNYFFPNQFENVNNPKAHIKSTALEILEQFNGELDLFVAGIGTGGTFTGIGTVLKEKINNIKLVGVEPESSPVISKGVSGSHKIQGIGANFVPSILNLDLMDVIEPISDENAIETTKKVAVEEGILLGISSGAAIFAAMKWAKKLGKGKKILAIAPDSGERYLSTGIFD